MEPTFSQQDIDATWKAVWDQHSHISAKKLFTHRLFEEGYSRFRRYMPHGNASILEVGAGSGRYALALAREFKDAQFTITDTLPNATENIARYAEELGLLNVTVEVADACALSYQDGTFDVVFGDAVIQHILDEEKAMAELTRVLKPGGTLILSAVNTLNPPHYLYKSLLKLRGTAYEYGQERTYTPRELASLYRRYGYVDLIQDGFHLAYGVYRLKRHWSIAALLGRILNRFVKFTDIFTARFLSRKFGFEIMCIGKKP